MEKPEQLDTAGVVVVVGGGGMWARYDMFIKASLCLTICAERRVSDTIRSWSEIAALTNASRLKYGGNARVNKPLAHTAHPWESLYSLQSLKHTFWLLITKAALRDIPTVSASEQGLGCGGQSTGKCWTT